MGCSTLACTFDLVRFFARSTWSTTRRTVLQPLPAHPRKGVKAVFPVRRPRPNRFAAAPPICSRHSKRSAPVPRAPATRTAVRISDSRSLEFDSSCSCRFCFRQNQMQYPVPEGCLNLVSINGLREREYPLVIAVGVLVINPLVSGTLVGAAASADRQNPPFEGDINPVGANAGHFGHHDDSDVGFVDVGRRQKYRPRRHALSAFGSCGCPLTDSSDCLGHGLTPPLDLMRRGFRSFSGGPLRAAPTRLLISRYRSAPGPCRDRPER